MAILGIRSNPFTQKASLSLSNATNNLQKSFEKLSSGLRINRASDDPAGLSVSSKLFADTRVFTQGIRNINDGVSLFNVAEGALTELSSVLTRLKELATQASNGTYSLSQRKALDTEGYQLTQEFNRIIEDTTYNGSRILDGNISNVAVQLGYGLNGLLDLSLTKDLDRTIGDGTFLARVSYSAIFGESLSSADVNGDGNLDLISTRSLVTAGIQIFLGNGNGTFQAGVSYNTDTGSTAAIVADFDGDGDIDIANVTSTNNAVHILLGNGNGSFLASVSYGTGDSTSPQGLTFGDVNGDNKFDLIVPVPSSNGFDVLLGNGNGSFLARSFYSTPSGGGDISLGDVNNDGFLDLVDVTSNSFYVSLGNGNGTFKNMTSYTIGSDFYPSVHLADLNYDGILDGIVTNSSLSVLIGNGDGSFRAAVTYTNGSSGSSMAVSDINGDGLLDVITASTGDTKINVFIGNGDGSFKAKVSFASITGSNLIDSTVAADFNEDGAIDIALAADNGNIAVLLANGDQVTTMPRLNLTTQAEARNSLSVIDSSIERLSLELSSIGTAQRRLSSALSDTSKRVEYYQGANSRIVDVDVAEETSNLAKQSITQQAATAMLAQANQISSIVLKLLRPDG